MTCGIYRIFNTTTNKSYIGSSINIEKRWKSHLLSLRNLSHRNRHLQHSYNLYGIKSFSFSILEETTKDMILEREKYWMIFYNTNDRTYGYNIYIDPTCPGYRKGKVPSEIRDVYGIDRLVSFVSPNGTIHKDIKNVTRFSEEQGLLAPKMNLVASGRQGVHRGWTKLNNIIPIAKSGYRKRRTGTFNVRLVNECGEIFHITNLQQFCEEHTLPYTPLHNMISGLAKTSYGFTLLINY